MARLLDPRRSAPAQRRLARAVLTIFLALGGCGREQSGEAGDAEELAPGYSEVNGYLVPPRELPDATLPDSCALLVEADPKRMIAEPLAPLLRMSNVCIAHARSTPSLETSLAVELRHPEAVEIEAGGLPSSKETFMRAEGASVGLMGGREAEVVELPDLADYAVWYPINGGVALHAYWRGQYILRFTIRGLPVEPSLEWAKQVTRRAIAATAAAADPQPVNRRALLH